MKVKTTTEHQYSLAGVHLPERKTLTTKLEIFSFFLNDFVLASSILALVAWMTNASFFKIFLAGFFSFSPIVAILFIFAGSTLLFSAKYYITELKNHEKRSIDFSIIIPLLLGGITSLGGMLSIFFPLWAHVVPPMVGFTLVLLGLALALPHVRISHRFHITQLLAYMVVIISAITILGYIYQLLSSSFAAPIIPIPLNIAILLFLLCHSILLRWSNRGFFGNFTIDCSSSIYALRLLFINLTITPIIGFLVLSITQKDHNVYIIVALLILLLMVVTTILAWFNMKLLYKFELERFAMREALRVHNIALLLDKKTQDVKLVELEATKKEYQDKLNHQDKLKNVMDTLG